MLEEICFSKRIVKELRSGPLARCLDKIVEYLAENHDKPVARSILLCSGRFAEFAASNGRYPPDLTDKQIIDFLLEGNVSANDAFWAHREMRTCLRDLGVIAVSAESNEPIVCILGEHDDYLRTARGISHEVRVTYAETMRQLFVVHRRRHGELPLAHIRGEDVLEVFQKAAPLYESVSARQAFAGRLRKMLHYFYFRGLIDRDLASVVPPFVKYRLSTVPNHLPWETVQQLIKSIDTRVPPGKRDKAVIALIAGLGLRGGTIRELTLDQIHWRDSEICIPRTKSGRSLNLPLTAEIGEFLSDYILNERPASKYRNVFLRHISPIRPFSSRSSMAQLIISRFERAGIQKPKGVANLLRHSLATKLVNAGVPVKQVSDVFGHKSIDTTAIYTKVDLRSLTKVPLPFPDWGTI